MICFHLVLYFVYMWCCSVCLRASHFASTLHLVITKDDANVVNGSRGPELTLVRLVRRHSRVRSTAGSSNGKQAGYVRVSC